MSVNPVFITAHLIDIAHNEEFFAQWLEWFKDVGKAFRLKRFRDS